MPAGSAKLKLELLNHVFGLGFVSPVTSINLRFRSLRSGSDCAEPSALSNAALAAPRFPIRLSHLSQHVSPGGVRQIVVENLLAGNPLAK